MLFSGDMCVPGRSERETNKQRVCCAVPLSDETLHMRGFGALGSPTLYPSLARKAARVPAIPHPQINSGL